MRAAPCEYIQLLVSGDCAGSARRLRHAHHCCVAAGEALLRADAKAHGTATGFEDVGAAGVKCYEYQCVALPAVFAPLVMTHAGRYDTGVVLLFENAGTRLQFVDEMVFELENARIVGE